MNARIVPAALCLLLLAGCLHSASDGFAPQSTQVHRFDGRLTFGAPVAYRNGTRVPLPAALAGGNFPLSVEQMVGKAGGEPNIGVTAKGSLFVNTFDFTQKSTDHGKTWSTAYNYQTPGAPVTEDQFTTADPMLWVDPVTNRVFADQMQSLSVGFCTYLAWSDDDGATWTQRPAACGLPHIDHQKIMTAPYHKVQGQAVPANPVYPDVVYMCTNDQDLGTWCTMSYDGGLTWAAQTVIDPPDSTSDCGQINGHPAAYPDGTVAVALSAALTDEFCRRPLTVLVTEDNGLTWQHRTCAPGFGETDVDPDITVTPDGTAYMIFRSTDQLHYLLRSTDKFQTCQVFRISPPGTTLGVFQAITSGDDGKVSMAWLGTRDRQEPGATPSNATGGTKWHAFVTTSLDAEAAQPTFVTQQVTPDQDPVQIGCVWLGGGGGGPHSCRNLLDFIDMVADREGRTYVSITDGCVPRNGCSTDTDSAEYQSRDSQVAVLVQDHGRALRGNATLAPLGLTPPMPFPE